MKWNERLIIIALLIGIVVLLNKMGVINLSSALSVIKSSGVSSSSSYGHGLSP